MTRKIRCLSCKGTGEVKGEEEGKETIDLCPVCSGKGYIGVEGRDK